MFIDVKLIPIQRIDHKARVSMHSQSSKLQDAEGVKQTQMCIYLAP